MEIVDFLVGSLELQTYCGIYKGDGIDMICLTIIW